jgi:hypothetical protein
MLPAFLFSCSLTESPAGAGEGFPLSEDSLRTRFTGLLGELRVLIDGRAPATFEPFADRNDSFTLGGNGLARGDGVCVGVACKEALGCNTGRFEGDNGEGESGEFGEELDDLVTR